MNGYITRVADKIADILLGEGIDYVQSKAVFRAARIKAGLHAPKETRNAPARLTLEEQLRFTDPAGSDLLGAVRTRHGDVVGTFAADLLTADRHPFNTPADA